MARSRVRQMQVGRTALIQAAEKGNIDCARLLVEGGADTEAKDNVRIIRQGLKYPGSCVIFGIRE